MLFFTVIKIAFRSLVANKLRSFLAMLGIIIGVSAVIAMLSVGQGAKEQVLGKVSSIGTNLLTVRPSFRGMGGVNTGTSQNLKLKDAMDIAQLKGVDSVAPVVNGSYQVKYYNKNNRTSITGASATYFDIRNYEIAKGRFFTEDEGERNEKIAVIGNDTAENLFGENEPIGESIKINNINFQVIGVLKKKGDSDDIVITPYKTVMKQLAGIDYLREINIKVKDAKDISSVQEKITPLLRKNHRLDEEQEDDFMVRSQAEILETLSTITTTLTLLLGSIAGISLLVGGIGIMNIMLVTVTERTKEIGIRKAIGAKQRDILTQFLIESVFMSFTGGAIGVLFGVGIAMLITKYSPLKAVITTESIVLSTTFSVGVGVFFGFYPARRASKLDPIDALRYE
ncbi:MAG: ABC transporter permease [Candidatus Sericytochromatia bacterium]